MDGTPFGRYRLIELLGRGGMGEVWRAFDPATNRVVAVKVLSAKLADDPQFEERFRREAFAAAGLANPHVVPIHYFGEIDGQLYVDMRLIEGRDLQEVLASGPLDPARAVRIIEQVASALHAAHKIGLVHRDVKPSNILLDEDDFAYLIDFGIARAAGESSLTSTGAVIGTWAYLAPERLTKGQTDARADIYALACVLHECLTGSQPFPANSLEQQLAAHLAEPPPQPSVLQNTVPTAMDTVIAKGMAKHPDNRYSTTKDLASAARNAITTTSSRPQPSPAPDRPTERVYPPARDTLPPQKGARQTGDVSSSAAQAATPNAPPIDPIHAAHTLAAGSYAPPPGMPAAPIQHQPPQYARRTGNPGRKRMGLITAICAVAAALIAVIVIVIVQLQSPPESTSPAAGGASSATVSIGVKFDQPGLGLRNPDGTMSGFDVDVAKYVAEQLGYSEDKIEWKEAPSGQRETLIQNDQVTFIAATYAITDSRKEKVSFAGPYLVTGQSLLVKADNTDITGEASLQNNKKLCSVAGSTPAQRIKDRYPGVQLQQYDTYSACVAALNYGAVDAVTTDEVILAGYAAQAPGAFKLVGGTFSEENYGIGLKKGDTELCAKISDAVKKMESEGEWQTAWDENLGPAGVPVPAPPALDPC